MAPQTGENWKNGWQLPRKGKNLTAYSQLGASMGRTYVHSTAQGKALQSQLTFSVKKPWVRHDEHYHLDFTLPCQPLTGK